jgi:hypothetical protein
MKNSIRICALLAAVSVASPAMAADTITYNSGPTDTFLYGSGNAYVPPNSAVNTNDANELALRFHQSGQVAPASSGSGVYSFALGTSPISFDWSIDGNADNSLITVLDIGTGISVSYDPFCPGGPIANPTCANDNFNGANIGDPDLWQNSEQLSFAFLLGPDFDPNRNDTYQVTVTSATHSLTAYAQLGTGAVPEPATWAMMLVGFFGIGSVMRRKQAKSHIPQLA